MITEKLKELEDAKAKIVDLEKSIASQLNKELAALPAQYGFDSVKAFVKAVSQAAGVKRKVRVSKVAKPKAGKSRTRAVITDEVRAQVKVMVSNDKSGAEIASALGISLPSVQNIKKALGLVKSRKASKRG